MRTQPVELCPNLPGQHAQISRVDAYGPELGPGDCDGVVDPGSDVVGVHQQGGGHPERFDLCAKCLTFGLAGAHAVLGVEQSEGVSGGAAGGHTVAAMCLQVGRGFESREVGGAGTGHRRQFVGTP